MRRFIIVLIGLSLLNCKAIEVATTVTNILPEGTLSPELDSLLTEVIDSFKEMTPSQEYYVGRAVAANILQKYAVVQDEKLTQYVNKVGLTVAWASDRPETYGGYHFLILDTDDPLAYSAPGGFIFISKGLMRLIRTEEELACVLAHEVAHISKKHGLSAIKQDRQIKTFNKIIAKGSKYTSEEMQKLVNIYENVLDDVITTLIEKGYDRKQEDEADQLGAQYAYDAGYDPNGLKSFLDTLTELEASKEKEGKTFEFGLVKSHPDPGDRSVKLRKYLQQKGMKKSTAHERTVRFEAMKRVLG